MLQCAAGHGLTGGLTTKPVSYERRRDTPSKDVKNHCSKWWTNKSANWLTRLMMSGTVHIPHNKPYFLY